jgi:hypothetical protein
MTTNINTSTWSSLVLVPSFLHTLAHTYFDFHSAASVVFEHAFWISDTQDPKERLGKAIQTFKERDILIALRHEVDEKIGPDEADVPCTHGEQLFEIVRLNLLVRAVSLPFQLSYHLCLAKA